MSFSKVYLVILSALQYSRKYKGSYAVKNLVIEICKREFSAQYLCFEGALRDCESLG